MLYCSGCSAELPVRQPGAIGRPRSVCDDCKRQVRRKCDREYHERKDRHQGSCGSCGGPCQRQSRVCKPCYIRLDLVNAWMTSARTRKSALPLRCIACNVEVGRRAYRCLKCSRSERLNFDILLGKFEGPAEEIQRNRSARRKHREAAAPGYYTTQRRRQLLSRWQRKGRTCAYCDGPAETVDHVVPLALGGTNHEGNLAPACSLCNCAKGDNLLSAWRYGRRVRPVFVYAARSKKAA